MFKSTSVTRPLVINHVTTSRMMTLTRKYNSLDFCLNSSILRVKKNRNKVNYSAYSTTYSLCRSIVTVVATFVIGPKHVLGVAADPASDGLQVAVATVKDLVDRPTCHFFGHVADSHNRGSGFRFDTLCVLFLNADE